MKKEDSMMPVAGKKSVNKHASVSGFICASLAKAL